MDKMDKRVVDFGELLRVRCTQAVADVITHTQAPGLSEIGKLMVANDVLFKLAESQPKLIARRFKDAFEDAIAQVCVGGKS
jgi:hypothetical protein